MGSKSLELEGMEVPIIGSDSVKWLGVSVPSSSPPSTAAVTYDTLALPPPPSSALPSRDAASCSIIGDPPTYVFWRLVESRLPEVLADHSKCLTCGRRVFSYMFCVSSMQTSGASGNPYLLYALTVSGVAYLFRLKSIYDYASYSVFPPNQIIMYNIQSHPPRGTITAITATAGCLVIGRNDGSITCFQLGILEPGGPSFGHELRDDAGFGRLWGLVSRVHFHIHHSLIINKLETLSSPRVQLL
ncbi:hypothetical protein Vadar_030606 [Vaccinium darrowii]|uniref:Uncharacterized protein n=1 Tax=Vaccinium darrowii TaxID=229202 RepID=A0ACB7XKZ0_9ERIC|nr:hypothetical protein Vadar_030606 [Vaccinium darrowii]